MWDAANFFFLSFSLRGISFTDLAYLTKENIYKDCITYRRRKTKKLYTIKIHPVAGQIFNFYKGNETDYLIPVFPKGTIEDSEDSKKVTRQWIKTTNKYLNRIAAECQLENNITTYVTRHTYATVAKRLGYSNEMIAEALGHEYGNKITNIYLDDFDQSLIDEMNDKVITSVIPCLKMIKSTYKFTLRPSVDIHKYKIQKANLSVNLKHNLKL
jgi:integrase